MQFEPYLNSVKFVFLDLVHTERQLQNEEILVSKYTLKIYTLSLARTMYLNFKPISIVIKLLNTS